MSRPVLLLMDFQHGIVEGLGKSEVVAAADRDDEVHRVLTEKVFPRQALVTTTDEWAASL